MSQFSQYSHFAKRSISVLGQLNEQRYVRWSFSIYQAGNPRYHTVSFGKGKTTVNPERKKKEKFSTVSIAMYV